MTKTIALLGATGSIGRQSLDIVKHLGIGVAALTAGKSVERMAEQCRELARIHRQNMLNRQHDSRMSAAAAVAGAVAGAALMRHHDAEAQQARLDQMAVAQRTQQFTALAAKLDALSPLKVLGRGYAVARNEQGQILRAAQEAAAGEKIEVLLGQGSLNCTVNACNMGGNDDGKNV